MDPHSHQELRTMLFDIMSEGQQEEFNERFECDFSFSIESVARFRVNVFTQRHGIAAAFRVIPSEVTTLEEPMRQRYLKTLSMRLAVWCWLADPRDRGKSTTLAAMVDYINRSRSQHILTIEDPIEFVHENKQSLISQREVHRDTRSFEAALRSALREDPDVILVGEMRDLQTIRLAMTAAETAFGVGYVAYHFSA